MAASVADVSAVEQHLQAADLKPFHQQIQQAPVLLLDANLAPETLQVSAVCPDGVHSFTLMASYQLMTEKTTATLHMVKCNTVFDHIMHIEPHLLHD